MMRGPEPVDYAKPFKLNPGDSYVVESLRNVGPGVAEVRFSDGGGSSSVIVHNVGDGRVDLGGTDMERWRFAKALFAAMVSSPALERILLEAVGDGRVFTDEEVPAGSVRWRRSGEQL